MGSEAPQVEVDELTPEQAVEMVADALNTVGYTAEAVPSIGVVNVEDPADAESMYTRADTAVPGDLVIDVRMTHATKFQIDPDANGRLVGSGE